MKETKITDETRQIITQMYKAARQKELLNILSYFYNKKELTNYEIEIYLQLLKFETLELTNGTKQYVFYSRKGIYNNFKGIEGKFFNRHYGRFTEALNKLIKAGLLIKEKTKHSSVRKTHNRRYVPEIIEINYKNAEAERSLEWNTEQLISILNDWLYSNEILTLNLNKNEKKGIDNLSQHDAQKIQRECFGILFKNSDIAEITTMIYPEYKLIWDVDYIKSQIPNPKGDINKEEKTK